MICPFCFLKTTLEVCPECIKDGVTVNPIQFDEFNREFTPGFKAELAKRMRFSTMPRDYQKKLLERLYAV